MIVEAIPLHPPYTPSKFQCCVAQGPEGPELSVMTSVNQATHSLSLTDEHVLLGVQMSDHCGLYMVGRAYLYFTSLNCLDLKYI